MDSEHRFLAERAALTATGNEEESGTNSLMLLAALLIGVVILAASVVIAVPESLQMPAGPEAAAAVPESAQTRAIREQYPARAGDAPVDPRIY